MLQVWQFVSYIPRIYLYLCGSKNKTVFHQKIVARLYFGPAKPGGNRGLESLIVIQYLSNPPQGIEKVALVRRLGSRIRSTGYPIPILLRKDDNKMKLQES